jgi:hypothetical protein
MFAALHRAEKHAPNFREFGAAEAVEVAVVAQHFGWWVAVAAAIASPLATLGAIKFLPDIFSKILLEGIEQRNRRSLAEYKDELERSSSLSLAHAKAALTANYDTLKSSMDFLSAGQTGLRAHSVEAVQALWREVLALKSALAGLWTFEQILTAEEKQAVVSGNDFRGRDYITPYLSEPAYMAHIRPLLMSEVEFHRPFCGERLWLIFVIFRSVHLRSAFLTQQAVKKGRHKRLLDDNGINELLGSVLPHKAIAEAKKQPFNDLNSLFAQLEGLFLREAVRVMSGSNAVAESLADMQATLLLQTKVLKAGQESA